jgi:Uma2 family endonuclease
MSVLEASNEPLSGERVWPISVPAYHALAEAGFIPKNTELLHGTVYQKMSKSPLHSALVRRLLKLLQKTSIPGAFATSEQPITCGDSEPEPDIAIVRGAEEEFWDRHPENAELVMEICVTSHDFDRWKLNVYAAAEIKECWLILAHQKTIEVYRHPVAGEYSSKEIFGPKGTIKSSSIPEFTLDLAAFFSR